MSLTCAHARRLAHELLDGELGAGEAERLQAHIDTCASCPALYAALVTVRNQLRRVATEGDRD